MKKLVALAIVVVVAMSGGHLFAQLSKDAAIAKAEGISGLVFRPLSATVLPPAK